MSDNYIFDLPIQYIHSWIKNSSNKIECVVITDPHFNNAWNIGWFSMFYEYEFYKL